MVTVVPHNVAIKIMIDLPVTFIDDITANASQLITDLSDPITLIMGVLLAVVVTQVLIRTIKN